MGAPLWGYVSVRWWERERGGEERGVDGDQEQCLKKEYFTVGSPYF